MKITSVLRAASAAFFFALISQASAQTGGIYSQGQVCGNAGVTAIPCKPTNFADLLTIGPSTLNVNHSTGVDTATCGSLASPCATIYHAFKLFQATVKVAADINPTIQSDCNFTETPPGAFLGPAASGTGVVFIVGNASSPLTCNWTTSGITVDDGAVISLHGFHTMNAGSGQSWLSVAKGGTAVFADMAWGTATGGNHIHLANSGANFVWDGGTYQIGDSGCAPTCFNNHIFNFGGNVAVNLVSPAISLPSVLTFSNFYISLNSGSSADFSGISFTGAGSGAGSTGAQYNVSSVSTLTLAGAVLPGSSGGGKASGACVDGVCASILAAQLPAFTGDVTSPAGSSVNTLVTAQPAVHTWALAQTFTVAPVFTDQAGSRTALGLGALATVTPGTGVATALAVNVGTAGAPVVLNGALGTPSSGVGTNLTGTASGLTAGNVTTNANLTGDVTSSGNATTLTNAPVIAKVLTGFSAGAGTVAATDSILQAFQKLGGLIDNTAWTAFTPSLACGTATFTVNSARFKTRGKSTQAEIDYTITAIGTCTHPVTFTLPNTANSPGSLIGMEFTNTGAIANCQVAAGSATATCNKMSFANFAVNDHVQGASGVYENQ